MTDVAARSAVLADLVNRLDGAADLATVQEVVRGAPRRLVGAMGATFVIREGERCFYADEDAIAPLWKGQRFPLESCISGWAMLNDATAVVPDIFTDARIPVDAYRPTFVRSLVMVPIGRPAVAAMGAYWPTPYRPDDADVATLERLSEAAASAMARIGLEGAPRDPDLRVSLAGRRATG